VKLTFEGTLDELLDFSEKLARIKKLDAKRAAKAAKDPQAMLIAETVKILRESNPIAAIKFYREKTGTTLKEAKDVVEQLRDEHGLRDKPWGPNPVGIR
jgi:ribosomal protein L7/L12